MTAGKETAFHMTENALPYRLKRKPVRPRS